MIEMQNRKTDDNKPLLKIKKNQFGENRCKKQIIPVKCQLIYYIFCCCCCDKDWNTENENNAYMELLHETQEGYREDIERHEELLKKIYDYGQDLFTEEQKDNEIPWKVYGFTVEAPRDDLIIAGVHLLNFMLYFMKNYRNSMQIIFRSNLSFVDLSKAMIAKLIDYLVSRLI